MVNIVSSFDFGELESFSYITWDTYFSVFTLKSKMYKKTYASRDVIRSLNIYSDVKSFRKAAQICGRSLSTIHRALKKAKISRRNFDTTKVCLKSKEEMNDIYRRFNDQMEKFQDNEIVCIDETYLCNIGNASYGYISKEENIQSLIRFLKEKHFQ